MRIGPVLALSLLVAAIVAYGSWMHRLYSTCPPLDRLRALNPRVEARRDMARGDRHWLGIGGYAGTVPGGGNEPFPVTFLPGTMDSDGTWPCLRLGPFAEAYARAYNETVLRNGN